MIVFCAFIFHSLSQTLISIFCMLFDKELYYDSKKSLLGTPVTSMDFLLKLL